MSQLRRGFHPTPPVLNIEWNYYFRTKSSLILMQTELRPVEGYLENVLDFLQHSDIIRSCLIELNISEKKRICMYTIYMSNMKFTKEENTLEFCYWEMIKAGKSSKFPENWCLINVFVHRLFLLFLEGWKRGRRVSFTKQLQVNKSQSLHALRSVNIV